MQERRSEWLPSRLPTWSKKKTTQAAVYAPSPVRLVLRPTFVEVSPSPIEYLPAQVSGAGTFRCDHDHDRSEIELQWYPNRRTPTSSSSTGGTAGVGSVRVDGDGPRRSEGTVAVMMLTFDAGPRDPWTLSRLVSSILSSSHS